MKKLLIALTILISLASGAHCAEIRGYWVDAYHNGFFTPAQADKLIADVKASNMNTIFVQVRRRGGVYYPSAYEPFEVNADPKFDALDYIVKKAHAANPRIAVHAWLCTFPVWSRAEKPASPKHIINAHPEWITKSAAGAKFDGENYSLDPAVPAVSDHLVNMAVEIAKKYDVDGIQFDFIRYANRNMGYNPVAVSRFNKLTGKTGVPAAGDPEWLKFRRNQITQFMRRVYVSVAKHNFKCLISADTIAWGNGPATDAGWYSTDAYNNVLQDWRSWLEEGIIDIVAPMIYFNETANAPKFNNWCSFLDSHTYDRDAVIGVGGFVNTAAGTAAQLRRAAENHPNIIGQVIYSYAVPYKNGSAAAIAPTIGRIYSPYVSAPVFARKTHPVCGHVLGRITKAGKPVDGIPVFLNGKTCDTDANGYFAFVDVAPGTHNLAYGVSSVGEKVTVTKGHVAEINIELK